jgi:hypothetical protein
MSPPAPKSVRRRFLAALGRGLYVTWPVLSGILVIEVALGLLIGFVEGWSMGEAVYFSFITGLTIGYGDIVPRAGAHARTRDRDRLWRHPPDRPGGWNRRQCNACDPDGRR